MLRSFVTILYLALGLGLVVLTLGIGAAMNEYRGCIFGLGPTYIQALAPEIGGLGLAVIVGGIAGLVAARYERGQNEVQLRKSLKLKKEHSVPFTLSDVLGKADNLPLAGSSFANEDIFVTEIISPTFADRDDASTLTDIKFVGCEISGARFSKSAKKCELSSVWFENSKLHRCDFQSTKISHKGGSQGFSGSELNSCRFDGAHFENVSLEGCVLKGCTFWGAKFTGSSRLPPDLNDLLSDPKLSAIEIGNGERRILTIRELLSSPTPAKLLAVTKFQLGLTRFGSKK